MNISQLEVVARLLLAAVMGGLIGIERESHGRPAGFRTHILVCVGSSLVMLTSIYGFWGLPKIDYDPGRLAAQVISGIGFLGAGTIMREGATIRGLTTAASLWVVAGIGLAIGSGFYLGASTTTILVVIALVLLNKFEQRFLDTRQKVIVVTISDYPGRLAAISSVLAEKRVSIKSVDITPDEPGVAVIELGVEMPPGVKETELWQEISTLEGIRHVQYSDS